MGGGLVITSAHEDINMTLLKLRDYIDGFRANLVWGGEDNGRYEL